MFLKVGLDPPLNEIELTGHFVLLAQKKVSKNQFIPLVGGRLWIRTKFLVWFLLLVSEYRQQALFNENEQRTAEIVFQTIAH